ncbi:response regulator [Chloroflexota bacterium]
MLQSNTNRARVSVTDDGPIISRIYQQMLSSDGFDVNIAINGLVAEKIVNGNRYDLCFADIRGKLMNGMEFYEYLKKKALNGDNY